MADLSTDRDPDRYRAVGLLALCAALHMGYLLFAPEDRADAWNAAGAVVRSAFLVALAWQWGGPILKVVWIWLAEEALVAGCSVAYIVRPWVVPPGQDQCSALVGFDLGKVSAVVMIGLLIWLLSTKNGR